MATPEVDIRVAESGLKYRSEPTSGLQVEAELDLETSVVELHIPEPDESFQAPLFELQTSKSVFECLTDDQATTLLLSMDAKTLLEYGRFSFFPLFSS